MGISLKVLAPTGQYDPTKLVNWGIKPMGLQTGTWLFQTLGQLDTRFVRRSVVLYDQSTVFFATVSQAAEVKSLSEASKAT